VTPPYGLFQTVAQLLQIVPVMCGDRVESRRPNVAHPNHAQAWPVYFELMFSRDS
jgi:hypothetical protein